MGARRSLRRLCWLCVCGMLWLWLGGPAWSFERTRTSLGIPVFWEEKTLDFFIGRRGFSAITDGSDIEVVKQSAAVWTSVPCSQIELRFAGLLDQPKAEYLEGQPNQNVVYWVESPEIWPVTMGALALTTIEFEPATGKLKDADMQLNGIAFQWSSTAIPGAMQIDIMNTVVHEFGHVLGLDHSFERDATMFADAPSGETKKRDLFEDDVAGLCSIYGATVNDRLNFEVVRTDDGRRACPTSKPVPVSPPLETGCSTMAGTPHGQTGLWFLGCLGLLLWCRRFKRVSRLHRGE